MAFKREMTRLEEQRIERVQLMAISLDTALALCGNSKTMNAARDQVKAQVSAILQEMLA